MYDFFFVPIFFDRVCFLGLFNME